jgi:hypothetical protein
MIETAKQGSFTTDLLSRQQQVDILLLMRFMWVSSIAMAINTTPQLHIPNICMVVMMMMCVLCVMQSSQQTANRRPKWQNRPQRIKQWHKYIVTHMPSHAHPNRR